MIPKGDSKDRGESKAEAPGVKTNIEPQDDFLTRDIDDEDAIDVGDDLGVVVDGKEYYGTIIAFDDENGTVTIVVKETGLMVTGDQSAMFLDEYWVNHCSSAVTSFLRVMR